MKKNIILVLSSLLVLASCSQRNTGKESVVSLGSVLSLPTVSSSERLKLTDSSFVSPFNTYISGNVYCHEGDFTTEQIKKMQDDFHFDLMYYHALSDRHHSYTLDDSPLTNIKTINDSYGKEERIQVDPYLYDLLKRSFEFSLQSEDTFNIFLGYVNDIYEDKIARIQSLDGDPSQTRLDFVLSEMSNLPFSTFSQKERQDIERYVSYLPSKEEMENVLSFYPETSEIQFHTLKDENGNVRPLAISLGGCAKGYASQRIVDDIKKEYPDICLILNSGTSSIKATGIRPDKKDWNIRYVNPAYQEQKEDKGIYNDYEVMISVQGGFNLSTSGYYENYFLENEGDGFVLRSHILNPKTGYSVNFFDQVSIYLDDAFLSDMYTTSLMNTSSLSQAKNLFEKYNRLYDEKNASYIFCLKEKEEKEYHLSMDSFAPLSSFGLPIVNLRNGQRYEGDYSDINVYDIDSFVTKRNDTFQESYYMSADLYQRSSDMSGLKLPNISKRIPY